MIHQLIGAGDIDLEVHDGCAASRHTRGLLIFLVTVPSVGVHAIEHGAEKTKEGAKKTGEAIKGVFTDSDKDSDKDGK